MISRCAARCFSSLALSGMTSNAPGAGLARVNGCDARQLFSLFNNIGKRIAHGLAWSIVSKACFHAGHYLPLLGDRHGADSKELAP